MLAKTLEKKIYVAVEDGTKVERYSYGQLYEKLNEMNDFDRVSFIKNVNSFHGYEAVNYKLLQQMYEQVSNDTTVKHKNDELDEFRKDYMKAYMKMMSA